MSEKEQSEVLKLLGEIVKAYKAGTLSPALIASAEAFLALPVVAEDVEVGPESHGQRRS